MKYIFLILFFLSSHSFAASDLTGWRWGVGWGVQALTNSNVSLEFTPPAFHVGEQVNSSVVFNLTSHESTFEDLDNDNYGMLGARVMYEMRHKTYKEVISSYFRIGAGYMWLDEALNNGDDMFILPVFFGVDVLTHEVGSTTGSFFVQVGYDFNFEDKDYEAFNLDGSQIWGGVRLNY